MGTSQSDRNLLFGVIALQLDILDKSQFADACALWALNIDRPMADILEERGWITPDGRQLVTLNLEWKLKKQRGDVRASLAETADSSVREILRSIDQPAVRQSLNGLPPAVGHVLLSTVGAEGTRHPSERYTLSHVHGEGGLGRVWLARDTELNRKVALKEVRLDKSTDARYLRRFVKEAQVTGQLEHPNIVPVYELARRKENDQPFYAMRFVEGRTLGKEIADFHRERDGKPTDRLELQRRLLEPFVKICEAIGYAHSRNVIHRDLKPENVVLGDHGEVIVLDWGLAKVLGEPGGPDATVAEDAIALSPDAETDQTQGPVGTPAFMAPEQVAADPDQIDRRTDLYGLGAILFTILANRPPGQGGTREEIYQNLAAGRIPRAREVDPTVPGPLDAICARALSLKREDRYQSVVELADDVRRWMIDKPVSVYRDPLTVRLTRWGRKHRTLVTTAAAVLLMAAISAALVASQQAFHARALDVQRLKAERREQLAIDAVKRFGDAVSKNAALRDNPALVPLRRELLKEPLSFFKTLREQLQADRDTRPESLRRLASAAFELANLTAAIGDQQDALRAAEEALAIRERLARENPTVTQFQSDLAGSHNNIGNLQREMGHPGESLESNGRARAIFEQLTREHPESPDFASDLGGTLNNIAMIDLTRKRYGEARTKLEQAIVWQKKARAANPRNPVYHQFMVNHMTNLFQAANGLKDSVAAAEAQREVDELKTSDPRFAAIDARLAAVFKGESPKDNPERLALARRAYDTGRHTAAARLWGDALEAHPKLADDRQAQHRYNAACAAALAGSGKGKDDPTPDEAARVRLRGPARAWLAAELAAWTRLLEAATPAQRTEIAQTLQYWQKDTDLAGVRESKAIDKLPEAERDGWRLYWKKVAATLARAQEAKP